MTEAPTYPISKRAKYVFGRFQSWYGIQRITEMYGPFPPRDWCELIDENDRRQLTRAMEIIKSTCLMHPPTFPQFSQALKPSGRSALQMSQSLQSLLAAFVVRTKSLTNEQRRLPWTFLYRGDPTKTFEVTGVDVPADGDRSGYRVMVEDMQLAQAEAA